MPSFVTTRDPYTPQQSSRVEAGYRGAPIYSKGEMAKGVKIDPYTGVARGVAGVGQFTAPGFGTYVTKDDLNTMYHRTNDLWTGMEALATRINAVLDDVWKVAQQRVSGLPSKASAKAGATTAVGTVKSAWDAVDKSRTWTVVPGFDEKIDTGAYETWKSVTNGVAAQQQKIEKNLTDVLAAVTPEEVRKIRDQGFQQFMTLQPERIKDVPARAFGGLDYLLYGGIAVGVFFLLSKFSAKS